MTGRGIDQILQHPGDPQLHEAWMNSALGYVQLAERENGPIPRQVPWDYIWGEALADLQAARPDARIVNLETSITRSDDWQPKGINYRMNPANVPCLTAASLDCCGLANNHVLDWGEAGLLDTLAALEEAGIAAPGAGRDAAEAARPAILEAPGKGRILVFSFASGSSGVPDSWEAGPGKPGVRLLREEDPGAATRVAAQVAEVRQPGDVVVASIHWGGNWGYFIPPDQRRLAHALIDEAGVDVVHGHSSHHAKGIEVYRDRLILYGCGDLLTDYEGISGHEQYRGNLGLLYLPRIEVATGKLLELRMRPTRVERFRLVHASWREARWLCRMFSQEEQLLGTRARREEDQTLVLEWGA